MGGWGGLEGGQCPYLESYTIVVKRSATTAVYLRKGLWRHQGNFVVLDEDEGMDSVLCVIDFMHSRTGIGVWRKLPYRSEKCNRKCRLNEKPWEQRRMRIQKTGLMLGMGARKITEILKEYRCCKKGAASGTQAGGAASSASDQRSPVRHYQVCQGVGGLVRKNYGD